ncbi:Response regulator transcription factor [Sulfidibacter corallicola]|uniref:Sensory transduction protein RegX3 n=1 Tax=Sulfidibacter corallicola TaxID=2818388 RepID=A0A8A4TN71_SULCO|nr:response regulator transcription factor [Sulfidibacter corallicola]QTD50654.1 response regulator transcription factor [Sulfidibacter corallicola]
MRRPRILIVEDEIKTAHTMRLYFNHAGFDATIVRDGRQALDLLDRIEYDLICLDLMLPGVDGHEICRRVRGNPGGNTETSADHPLASLGTPNKAESRANAGTPIIMVTARTQEGERIDGLDLGADDYVSKPFSPRELVARVRAVLRRAGTRASNKVMIHGPLRLDPAARQVTIDGRPVPLTPTELDLLTLFLEAGPQRVLARENLIDALFGVDHHGTPRTVDVHIKNLRAKIEPDRRHPTFILTVFGMGYKLGEPLG